MNLKKLLSLAAMCAALGQSAMAVSPYVIDIELEANGEFQYDATGITLDDGPLADLMDDNDVFGYGQLSYAFYNMFVAPDFSLSATYDWCIELSYEYGYSYFTTNQDSGGYGDGGYITDEFTGSVDDVTLNLTGMTAMDLWAFLNTLPGEGSLAGLLTALSASWPFESDISSSDIYYTTDFSLPTGTVEFAVDAPVADWAQAYAAGYLGVNIKAKEHRNVPDSGSTSFLAIGAFAFLLYVRRRFAN